jgi:hypothetical protein
MEDSWKSLRTFSRPCTSIGSIPGNRSDTIRVGLEKLVTTYLKKKKEVVDSAEGTTYSSEVTSRYGLYSIAKACPKTGRRPGAHGGVWPSLFAFLDESCAASSNFTKVNTQIPPRMTIKGYMMERS